MKDAKRSLKKKIRKNKRRCLKELQDEVEQYPWGRPYRIVMKKIKGNYVPPPKCPSIHLVVSTLFPRKLEKPSVIERGLNKEANPPITIENLLAACRMVGNNKAPRPDGIPNIALLCMLDTSGKILERIICVRMANRDGLELASHKTEVILISNRKKIEEITLTFDGREIVSQPTIKYLGITIAA
ncbi:hypothetical protein TSAR_003402 [Trichomalopsis sarcophagae]|uniref:Reverse transcriptase domain-containing protein n=1 Tax=Trichomalopsis sarcophagae TaxID=543379 RepID=A0A232FIY7_9HYME|nr:hypothetical protein TSAR_003402 [Trichomalopsis sarcophagae]